MARKKLPRNRKLSELENGEIVGYVRARYYELGLQTVDDGVYDSVDEINDEEKNDFSGNDAVLELRIVARRNPTPFVPLPSKLIRKKRVKK